MKVVVPYNNKRTGVTFSRNSIATERTPQGLFKIVANDTLRLNYFLDADYPKVNYFDRFLIEPKRTNYLKNTASDLTPSGQPIQLVNQTVDLGVITSENSYLTLSFFGTGTVTVIGGGFTYSLKGSANSSSSAASYITFPARAKLLAVNVEGSVYAANLEGVQSSLFNEITNTDVLTAMTRPTSWIPTTSSIATRFEDNLTTSGILFSDFSDNTQLYSPAVAYAAGEEVRYGDNIYISLTTGNSNNDPNTNPDKWSKISTSNDVALLDLENGGTSSAVNNSTGALFSYAIKFGDSFPKTVSLIGIDSDHVDLSLQVVTNAGVFSKNLNKANLSSLVLDDLFQAEIEPYSFRSLTVYYVVACFRLHNGISTETGNMLYPDSEVKIGEIVLGVSEELGKVQYGMQSSIVDYSVKTTNDFGVSSFVRRGFSKRLDCQIAVDNKDYNRVIDTLSGLRALPTVWIATSDDTYSSAAIVFGTYNSFSLSIQYPTMSLCSLEIEGLVI